ncbi:hypothetical protein B0H14DRAFT_3894547 [Mycena olivaceomarginata]|nr:hypothetical protein B0H14DRAFT_3894547 [Mycena olivaceomarginata]
MITLATETQAATLLATAIVSLSLEGTRSRLIVSSSGHTVILFQDTGCTGEAFDFGFENPGNCINGERETIAFDDLPDLVPPDDDDDDAEDEESDSAQEDSDGNAKMNDLCAVIQEASKCVVESTDAEYGRY